jgi:lysophospholipase L1-like esterase
LKVQKLKKINDPVIFYGSSTIRLWNSIKKDFPKTNVINLGFGGAYIDSLSKNFKTLFKFKKPKIIVIYLGGNDLNLKIGLDLITKKIINFIFKINKKYPDSKIGYISIKPSLERKNKLNEIIMINDSIRKFSKNFDKLVYIDIFNKLLHKRQVTEKYLLQDGLHLNKEGYKILTRSVKKALNL